MKTVSILAAITLILLALVIACIAVYYLILGFSRETVTTAKLQLPLTKCEASKAYIVGDKTIIGLYIRNVGGPSVNVRELEKHGIAVYVYNELGELIAVNTSARVVGGAGDGDGVWEPGELIVVEATLPIILRGLSLAAWEKGSCYYLIDVKVVNTILAKAKLEQDNIIVVKHAELPSKLPENVIGKLEYTSLDLEALKEEGLKNKNEFYKRWFFLGYAVEERNIPLEVLNGAKYTPEYQPVFDVENCEGDFDTMVVLADVLGRYLEKSKAYTTPLIPVVYYLAGLYRDGDVTGYYVTLYIYTIPGALSKKAKCKIETNMVYDYNPHYEKFGWIYLVAHRENGRRPNRFEVTSRMGRSYKVIPGDGKKYVAYNITLFLDINGNWLRMECVNFESVTNRDVLDAANLLILEAPYQRPWWPYYYVYDGKTVNIYDNPGCLKLVARKAVYKVRLYNSTVVPRDLTLIRRVMTMFTWCDLLEGPVTSPAAHLSTVIPKLFTPPWRGGWP